MKIKKIRTKPKNKARENEQKPKIKNLLSNVNVRYFDTWDEICVTKILLKIFFLWKKYKKSSTFGIH